MELNILESINKSKDKDVNQFMYELSKALKDNKNSINIRNQSKNEVESVEEEARDSYGFTETDYRRATDMENFAPTLAEEFGLSAEDLEILRKRINNYLKEYSKYCGIISYSGYDMNKDQYYDDWFEDGKRHRNKLTYQEFAQGYTMGCFYRWERNEKDSSWASGRLFEDIKDAIKNSIQEQLADGVSVKNINLLKLKDDIRNKQYLKPLYDNFDKNKK